MSEWNICAPGLSLNWEEVERKPTIAINTSLFQAPFADYWCCRDKPNFVLDQVKFHVRRLRPILVYGHSERAEAEWSEWVRENKIPIADMVTVGWDTLPWVKLEVEINPQATIFTAIIFAITRGATIINLHGVDMSGEGYFDKRLRTQKQDWKLRWHTERDIFRKMVRAAERRGVEFRRLPDLGRY